MKDVDFLQCRTGPSVTEGRQLSLRMGEKRRLQTVQTG